MKKISAIFLCFLFLIMTGCGTTEEKTLVCTQTESDEDMDIEQVISMTYANDKLKHMTMEVNTTIKNSDVKENWEEFKKTMDEDNQEFNKDGVRLEVTVDDTNYKYNTMLDIDVENASEEVLKEQGFEDLKKDNSTLEESKKEAEKDGAVCKIK